MEIFVTDKHDQFIIGNPDGNNGMAFLKPPNPACRRAGPKGALKEFLFTKTQFVGLGSSQLIIRN